MGVDDDWANWKPVQDSVAQGGSAFKARVALSSRGGSVSPDRRRSGPSSQAGRNAYNNNNNSRNTARDDRSAGSRPSPAKPADVAMRNFSRGDQQREPFNMRNGTANGTRDAPPPPSSSTRPSSDANPDRRARPRSPDLNRDRDTARRAEPERQRQRDDERRAGTPSPKSARQPEREDRSNRNKRDDRPRERSRSRDRNDRRDTRDKEKEKDLDRDRDSRRSKEDSSRRDRDSKRDGDRRDSARSDTRRKDDDNYRSSDRKSDRDTNERKPRDDLSPRERPSRREGEREDRRSSLKRARTPERSDVASKGEVQRDETRDNGRIDRRRDRGADERNGPSARSDARDRRQDRREEDSRQSKRMKEDTSPPKLAKSDLSASLEEPALPNDVEMRSNTPPPRVVEQVPEPIEPEAVPQVEDAPAIEEEVIEAPVMDGPYIAAGHTQDSLKKKPKILIRNLAPGTSHSDIQVFCGDFGMVLGVSSSDDPENTGSQIFEVYFNTMQDAEHAVSEIDNMQADGQILKANIVRNSGLRILGASQTNKAQSTVETPTTATPASSSAASLLSRLSGPAPPATANTKKAKAQANGSLPVDLLSPYTELLEKAGIRSLPALKKVLRPTSIPAYVEMLSDKYPNEELLSGLTAKWALRERLEEWLGEKEETRIDWGERPGR